MTIKDKVTDRIEMEGKYSQIPNKLFGFPIDKNKNTSAIAERIWGYLFSCSRSWNPGQRQISDKLRISTDQTKKGLDILQSAKMLTIHDRGTGTRHEYELEDHKYWKSCEEETVSDLGTVQETVSDLGTECPLSGDTSVSDLGTRIIQTKQNVKNEKNERTEKDLEYIREDIIKKWSKDRNFKNWESRGNSFLLVIGNLRDQGNLSRDKIRAYGYDIKDFWCEQKQPTFEGRFAKKNRISWEKKKKSTDQDFSLAISEIYSSVDLEDVEIKEIITPSVIKVEEYIPPSPDKILTLEKLEEIGEDTVGEMKFDYEFLKLCESVGEKE